MTYILTDDTGSRTVTVAHAMRAFRRLLWIASEGGMDIEIL